MRTEREKYIQNSKDYIKNLKKLERATAIVAGIFVGIGIGGYVALGMDPPSALIFVLVGGGGTGLEGAGIVLKRKHFEEEFERTLKRES